LRSASNPLPNAAGTGAIALILVVGQGNEHMDHTRRILREKTSTREATNKKEHRASGRHRFVHPSRLETVCHQPNLPAIAFRGDTFCG